VRLAARAEELVEQYVAVLSENDHFNSKGSRLTDAAAIIRQDRANYHKFGLRDRGDSGDNFFANAANRGLLERMLNRGSSSKSAINAIVNNTPVVLVQIFKSSSGEDFVNVSVME
jgi:hypothetical protein